jgi:hypothetical protein
VKLRTCRRAFLIAGSTAVLGACSADPNEAPEPLVAEAGFIEIEPVAYAIHGETVSLMATTSRARLFVSFQPAEEDSEDKPLLVLWNGGPGASSGILLGANTAPVTLDPARTGNAPSAANASSWTAFANLLYIDARGTGFSYGLAEGMEDDALRAGEFTVRNFNPFVDAADVVRVVLRFLAAHPRLQGSKIVLAGESYGGQRTAIALHLLHHPDRYRNPGALYQDEALAAEIEAHFAAAASTAASQLDRAIFLQPRLSSAFQQTAAGSALEAEGSILHQIAAETGVPFVPCSAQPNPCVPVTNVLDYLAGAGRDVYDVRKPAGDAFATYAAIGARLEDPAVVPQALGTDPAEIDAMYAGARASAYRLAQAFDEDEPLANTFGMLEPYDRYFEVELFDLMGPPFAGAEAQALGIERQHTRYGRLFLEDLLAVRAFVTNAAFDAAIWTPALPEALAMYTSDVESVHMEDEAIVLNYKSGAFGLEAGASRTLRFPAYVDAGHSVSLTEPDKLAGDIAAWLVE